MTDVKQRGPIGSGCSELNLQEHRHDRVEAGRSRLMMNREPAKPTAEQKVRSFNVRNSLELGK